MRVGPTVLRGNRVTGNASEAKGHAVALMMEEKYDDFADLRERAKAEVSKVVIGQDRTVELLLIAAVAHGHVLIEGPPGSAKTLIARAVAHMLGANFKRIQFTPDTTPVELNGQNVIRAGEHLFLPGAVFTNVLLADEINRTPPRTQAALFEPMQERQVTVDGKAHKLPDPFLVIATQNPFEHEGVFVLPEGQLDRFLFKIELDYADAESELAMLNLPHKGIAPDMLGEVRPLLGVVGLDKARQELEHTSVPESVGRYIVAVGRRTRELPGVELGVSSRAMIHLVNAAKANARLNGRDTVSVEDIREMAPYVLRHRIVTKPGTNVDHILMDALSGVPTPVPPPVSPVK
jgi:MoxR-like ATPase